MKGDLLMKNNMFRLVGGGAIVGLLLNIFTPLLY